MAKAPTTAVATQRPARPIDTFKAQLAAAMPMVQRMLPKHVSPEEFQSRVITAVANKPELLECTAVPVGAHLILGTLSTSSMCIRVNACAWGSFET